MGRLQGIAMPALAVVLAAGTASWATGVGPLADSGNVRPATIIPEPPDVAEMPSRIAESPDDGLHRYVVTPSANGLDIDESAAAAAQRALWSVSLDRIEQANGTRPTLVFVDGVPGYYDDDGEFVAVDDVIAPDGSLNDAASFGHPVMNELAMTDGVVRVNAIDEQSYAVVVTEPEVLSNFESLQVIEDLPLTFADDPYEPYQWAIDNTGTNLDRLASAPPQTPDADIDAPAAWSVATGEGVVVAVVDSGVDFSHPDLAAAQWTNDDEDCTNGVDDDGNGYVDDCRGWDFGHEDNQPYTRGHHAHGTHVAGIIAATADNGIGVTGIAPDVQIMDLSLSATGSMTVSSVARAIRYAVDNDADIVNLSLGTSPGVPEYAVTPIIDAVRYAEEAGVLLVVAAGNDSVNLDNAAVYPASIEATNLLTVGASSPSDTRASFSNYGTTVEVFAPGELILSTIPGNYNFMSGTSQAAPTAAAVAALVQQQRPDATASELIAQLIGTADEVEALAGATPSSARINAARAVGADPGAVPDDGTNDGTDNTDGGSGGDVVAEQPDAVVISGLAAASAEGVEAQVSVNAPDTVHYEEAFRWEASLIAIDDGAPYAVVDHQLTLDGASITTNDQGAFVLGTDEAMTVDIATTVPAGFYALMIEAVPESDPAMRLGDAYAATFVIPGDAGEQPGSDPSTPTTGPTQPSTPPSSGGNSTSGGSGSGSSGSSGGSGGSSGSGSGSSGSGSSGSSSSGGSSSGGSSGSGSSSSPSTGGGSGGSGSSSGSSSGSGSSGSSGGGGGTPSTGGGGSPSTGGGLPSTGGGSGGSGSSGGGGNTGGGSPVTNPPSTTTPAPGSDDPVDGGTDAPDAGDQITVPVPDGPVDEANGDWAVTSITPRFGYLGTPSFVSITGSFPTRDQRLVRRTPRNRLLPDRYLARGPGPPGQPAGHGTGVVLRPVG